MMQSTHAAMVATACSRFALGERAIGNYAAIVATACSLQGPRSPEGEIQRTQT